MRVAISRSAQLELDAIGNYIAADNRVRAESFVRELLDRCAGLAQHSERYPVVTKHRGEQVRRAPYQSYLILYSIQGEEVRVHHIVHGARDYMRLLFPND